MIYILTYADMNGVSRDTYNSFSAKLIRTLYKQSVEVLGRTALLDEAAKRAKKESSLKKYPAFLALKKSEQKKILSIPSNLMFLRYKPQRIVDISKKAFQTRDYEYLISNEEYLTIEIIREKPFNLGYLLGKLGNLEVVNMDICKLFNELKYFKIDFMQKVTDEELGFIENFIHDSFEERNASLSSKPDIRKDEVEIDCDHSHTYAIMHLKCKNQRGLLAYVIDIFDAIGIDIVTAKVHTLKNRVRDMFLIEKNGNFCHNTDKIIDKLTGKR
jgi:[protein-PII] uridylyltransferase